jgi:hypothetical protein
VQWIARTFSVTAPTDRLRAYLRHAHCPPEPLLERTAQRAPPPNATVRWLAAHLRKQSKVPAF